MILHQHQSKPFELYESNSVDALMRGLLMQPAQKMDRAFTDEVFFHHSYEIVMNLGFLTRFPSVRLKIDCFKANKVSAWI